MNVIIMHLSVILSLENVLTAGTVLWEIGVTDVYLVSMETLDMDRLMIVNLVHVHLPVGTTSLLKNVRHAPQPKIDLPMNA